jgi:hypothetical protein
MELKRLLLGLGVCVLAFGVVPARAEGIRFGVEGGVNASYLTIPKDVDSTRDVGAGLVAGAWVDVPLTETVHVQGEVLYTQRRGGVAILGGTQTNQIDIDYISIPVLAKLSLFKGIYAVEGVAFHFPVRAELDGADIKSSTKRDVSIVLGAGKMVGKRIGVEGRWNSGLRTVNSSLLSRNRSITGLVTIHLH